MSLDSVKNGLTSLSNTVWVNSHERPWTTAAGVICAYGLLKEFRPSEPFLNEYLMAPDRNFSTQVISKEIFPVWTYSLLLIMIPIFLLTDVLLYKPVIVLQSVALVATYVIFVSGKSKAEAMLAQFGYAVAYATDIAYCTYIYAAVHSDHYQKATSLVRAVPLVGRFLSSSLGQILISFKVSSYYTLYCISLVAVVCGALLSVFIPGIIRIKQYETAYVDDHEKPKHSTTSQVISETSTLHSEEPTTSGEQIETNTPTSESPSNPGPSVATQADANTPLTSTVQQEDTVQPTTSDHDPSSNGALPNSYGSLNADSPQKKPAVKKKQSKQNCCTECCANNFNPIWQDFKQCYTNVQILKWSLWCSLAVCTYFQVNSYTYRLLHELAGKEVNGTLLEAPVYNGAMEATASAVGGVAVLLAMLIALDMTKFGELIMGSASLIMAVVLLVMGSTANIWVAFVFYVIFKTTYYLVITIAAFQIARQLTMENAKYAMVIGFNSFEGFLLQTLITLIVDVGIGAPVGVQFHVSAVIMFVTGACYMMAFIMLQNMEKDTASTATTTYQRF